MIRLTEVDGIPTVLAPVAGPPCAGLVFRVGQADEHLPSHGITHLVEHLAMRDHDPVHDGNACTTPTTTQFAVQGSPEIITGFLTGVCRNLTDVPLDRFSVELDVLRREAETRADAVNDVMPMWRYGAMDFGLPSYPEFGLATVTPEQVASWAHTRFTRQNAVLWIAGDAVPAGLRLDLPDGVAHPTPRPSSALPVTPAYFTGHHDAFVFDTVVRRTAAARAYTTLLRRGLFRRLRQEHGYSYTTAVTYQPRDRDTATITVVVDTSHETRNVVGRHLVDALRELTDDRLTPADLDLVLARTDRAAQPDEAARVVGYAADLLLGVADPSIETAPAAWSSLIPESVRRVATEALESCLVMTPPDAGLEWAAFEQAPTHSRRAVAGVAWPDASDPDSSLVIGTDGVSTVGPDGPVTVRFADCTAMLAWADGGRRLIGADAMTVTVEPTLVPIGASTLTAIDAAVDPEKIIELAERDEEDIPQPPPVEHEHRSLRRPQFPRPPRGTRERSEWGMARRRNAALTVGLVAVLCAVAALALWLAGQIGILIVLPVGFIVRIWARAMTRRR